MKARLIHHFQRLSASHWFLPTLFSLFALVLLMLCVTFDHVVMEEVIGFKDSWKIQPKDISTLMSVVITSSISITGVVLSITMLMLSFISNQLGPRILPNFLRQGKTQFIIAIFLSIYVYCLVLLAMTSFRVISESTIFLPYYVGLGLALLSFIMLVYFIHHIIQSTQVVHIIEEMSKEIEGTLRREFIDEHDEKHIVSNLSIHEARRAYCAITSVPSLSSGYIQSIDYQGLATLAEKHKILIEVHYKPGHYLYKNISAMSVYHDDKENVEALRDQLAGLIQLGCQRTNVQDIEYGFDQISEIALRALSPSMNNPYTAINCIHKIGHLLQVLSTLQLSLDYRCNDQGDIRLIFQACTYDSVVEIALEQIRENVGHHISVIIEFIRLVGQLTLLELPDSMSKALLNQAQALYDKAMSQSYHKIDLNSIKSAYQEIKQH